MATEYGAQILGPGKGRNVLQGRLTEEQMEFLIREEEFTCVVDATHPFATEVSAQIRKPDRGAVAVCPPHGVSPCGRYYDRLYLQRIDGLSGYVC